MIHIRRFEESDAEAVSRLIRITLRISNAKDYPPETIGALVETHTPAYILQRAGRTHFYTVLDGERIVGCGAIGPYCGREDVSCLFTVFVLPEYQGRGVGRKLIETLERDEFFLRAGRTEIPASLTAVPFYLRMGYDYKDGVTEPDGERLVRLEKKRSLP